MQPVTHGDNYEEAMKKALEVIDLLIESYKKEGKELPNPKNLQYSLSKS